MLVVIAIIVVLAGLLTPAIAYARGRARHTKCTNNLRQLQQGLEIYKTDFSGRGGWDFFPGRLSFLFRDGYLKAGQEVLLCPADATEGMEGGKADLGGVTQFAELDEHPAIIQPVPPALAWLNVNTLPCSYMYEFSGAACSWGWQTWITFPSSVTDPLDHIDVNDDGLGAWGEVKQAQMRYGDKSWNAGKVEAEWSGYPQSKFPVLRCFWHAEHPNTSNPKDVLNMAYSGNVFLSPARWEDTAMK